MGHDATERILGENPSVGLEATQLSDFHIVKRVDGRWEVAFSRGKHKRIYERLIDASAGAVEAAESDPGPWQIRVERRASGHCADSMPTSSSRCGVSVVSSDLGA